MENTLAIQIRNLFSEASIQAKEIKSKKFLFFTLQDSARKLLFSSSDGYIKKGALYAFSSGKLSIFVVIKRGPEDVQVYQGIFSKEGSRQWWNFRARQEDVQLRNELKRISETESNDLENICSQYFVRRNIVATFPEDESVSYIEI